MDDLTVELAKFFVDAWDTFIGTNETNDIASLVQESVFCETVIATEDEVENGEVPEGIEAGDEYYVLSKLGHEAWKLAHEGK